MSAATPDKADSMSEKGTDLIEELHNSGEVGDYIYETRPWYQVPHLRTLAFGVFLITITSTNNGFDGSLLNGFQSLLTWQEHLGHPQGDVLGALSNGVTFGNIMSFVIASTLADKFGRKKCIIGGQAITILGAILQGVSTNYAFFFCSRVVIGIGSGIATVSSPTLISEIAFPTHRETSTFFYNVCWYLGAVVASWVTYGTRNIASSYSWRIPSFLQGALPLFQLAFFFVVPESPRYLIDKGHMEKAEKVLTRHHTGNSTDPRDIALVQFELKEIEAHLAAEKANTHASYADFWRLPNFRKRFFLTLFIPVMMQFSGNGLVSYYLTKVLISIGITLETMQLKINGCLMIYNLVICIALGGVVSRFKRRTMFLVSVSGMVITYVVWTALSAINQQKDFKDKSYANGVLAMIFLYYLAYNIGINGLPFLYITEVLPYTHRAKGINIFQVIQQFVSVFNGFVNPIAMDAIQWKYYIVYCCWLTVELLVVYFVFPETSGYSLEEVARVFGDDVEDIAVYQSHSKKYSVEHVEAV